MSFSEQLSLMQPIALALLLGGAIGFEREWRAKPAGLRTHVFVAVSSCLITLIGPTLVEVYSVGFAREIMRNEPLSILSAVILGISFIGAGTVFKDTEEKQILNLTTAATLLFAGTIGIAVGSGLYYLALAATVAVLCANLALEWIERLLPGR